MNNAITNQKYKLTNKLNYVKGRNLYRIEALRNIDYYNVKRGDLGGWIESEDNLSQEGDCWVGDEACVYGKAQVKDNSYVYGKAQVYDEAILHDDSCVGDQACVCGDVELHNVIDVCGNAKLSKNKDFTNVFEVEDSEDEEDGNKYMNKYGLRMSVM